MRTGLSVDFSSSVSLILMSSIKSVRGTSPMTTQQPAEGSKVLMLDDSRRNSHCNQPLSSR